MLEAVVADLRAEARRADERRLLVLTGTHDAALDAAATAIAAADLDPARSVYVGRSDRLDAVHVPPERAGSLLGTTQDAVVYDAHDGLAPNTLGRTVGTVDGGGLFVLLCPPLDAWPTVRDAFDETLAVPPFGIEDVTGRFRRRLVDTLRAHPGIAIVDVDAGTVVRDGRTRPDPRPPRAIADPPGDPAFPEAAYAACLTTDQVHALEAFEALLDPGRAVVVEADRGRGKSSAAGLAAASLAIRGNDVVVTAPEFEGAREAFARAAELCARLDARAGDTTGPPDAQTPPRRVDTTAGGAVRFVAPPGIANADPDVLIVDEAAAIPVSVLTGYLDVGRVAFATTIHGYEGAGRGFSVRFRDRLAASDLDVTTVTMREPIRYAPGDPVEVWAFRAMLLDATPAADQLVADATPDTVTYRALEPEDLLADEPRLREAFGLLVLAHYRTEPDDLARLLDAPNISVRALVHDGHVASVALLAREGGLSADRRAAMYAGGRVRGNMLPDVLTSQLRDEDAGAAVGQRVMRIATHAAVRSRGLGSRLLDAIETEFAADVDWLGTGYGATPRLLSFWAENGYGTVHLSTTRNPTSGEHSVLMLAPTSEAGRALADRHARWFAARIEGSLSDAHASVDPDVVRGTLAACDATITPDLTAADWRLVASMAYGPGLMDVDPRPFRTLAAKHLIDPTDPTLLTARQERLLVYKALQGHSWAETAAALEYHSPADCMRGIGEAYRPLVDAYGTEAAHDERDRYRD